MLSNIALGIYYPGNSLLHRLQARTKLLALLWIVLVIANHRHWHFAPYIAIMLLLCLGVAVSGVSPRQFWRRIWLLTLLAVIGALPVLLWPEAGGKRIYTLGPFPAFNAILPWLGLVYLVLLAGYLLLCALPAL